MIHRVGTEASGRLLGIFSCLSPSCHLPDLPIPLPSTGSSPSANRRIYCDVENFLLCLSDSVHMLSNQLSYTCLSLMQCQCSCIRLNCSACCSPCLALLLWSPCALFACIISPRSALSETPVIGYRPCPVVSVVARQLGEFVWCNLVASSDQAGV